MEDTTKIIIAAVMISFAVLGVGLATDFKFKLLSQTAGAPQLDTNIWCYKEKFLSCVPTQSSLSKQLITNQEYLLCPDDASVVTCSITDESRKILNQFTGKTSYYLMYANPALGCEYKTGLFAVNRWVCSGEQAIASLPATIPKGNRIYSVYDNDFVSGVINGQELQYCGTAGCQGGGVPISGAIGCSVNPSTEYNAEGRIVKTDSKLNSQIVTVGRGVTVFNPYEREVCGTILNECNTDADCIPRSNLGNGYSVIGLSLQKLSCVASGASALNELSIITSGSNIGSYGAEKTSTGAGASQLGQITKNACIGQEVKKLQCSSSAGCGDKYFCQLTDIDRFDFGTCVQQENTVCTQDYQCGTEQICSSQSKQLLAPKCNVASDTCEKKDVRSVACCPGANDCSSGYFCDTDYTCKQKGVGIVSCPADFQCCPVDSKFSSSLYTSDKNTYNDKPCPAGEFCKADHTCTGISPVPPPRIGDSGSQCDTDCSLSAVGIAGYPACVYDKVTCKVTHFLYWVAGIIIAMFLMTAVILYLKNK